MERGLRLKHLREKKTLSQTDASRYLGVSKQTLYKYENDIITNIPSPIIERMAKLYDTTPAYIMGWDDKEEEEAKERFIKASIHGDKLNQLAEAYDRADPVTKGIVDKILGLALPDADLPRSPEDNE